MPKQHLLVLQPLFFYSVCGIPVEEGDSILKLLRRVFRPEIQLGVGFYSELDFSFNC